MKKYLFILFVIVVFKAQAQEITAQELLDKSIAYHDPEERWANFKGGFTIKMETPNRPLRTTKITLDFPQQYFKCSVERGGVSTAAEWKAGNCSHRLEGSTSFTAEQAKEHGLNCERTNKMRDYYVYLYGLPMKLKDPGTHLDPKVYTKTLNGVSYYCLKVTYDEKVGKDTWYFYLDKTTAQLRHYQFYHNEAENDGEYILLSGEENVGGIKMPKDRAWYMNADNRYLGTDFLSQ
jgi:hypothetical protein